MAAFSQSRLLLIQEIREIGIHVTKFKKDSLCLLSVYRSNNGNVGLLIESLLSLVKDEKSVLILGDFNICNEKKPNNIVKITMTKNRFKLLTQDSTHICGGHIDHAYWKDAHDEWKEPFLYRHGAYYSDHDALCVTLERKD